MWKRKNKQYSRKITVSTEAEYRDAIKATLKQEIRAFGQQKAEKLGIRINPDDKVLKPAIQIKNVPVNKKAASAGAAVQKPSTGGQTSAQTQTVPGVHQPAAQQSAAKGKQITGTKKRRYGFAGYLLTFILIAAVLFLESLTDLRIISSYKAAEEETEILSVGETVFISEEHPQWEEKGIGLTQCIQSSDRTVLGVSRHGVVTARKQGEAYVIIRPWVITRQDQVILCKKYIVREKGGSFGD